MGHGGWEKVEYDTYIDADSGAVVPLICALRDGQIFEVVGEELQKVLDVYFPVNTERTLEAFRESWEEHRRSEAEYRPQRGNQSGQN